MTEELSTIFGLSQFFKNILKKYSASNSLFYFSVFIHVLWINVGNYELCMVLMVINVPPRTRRSSSGAWSTGSTQSSRLAKEPVIKTTKSEANQCRFFFFTKLNIKNKWICFWNAKSYSNKNVFFMIQILYIKMSR